MTLENLFRIKQLKKEPFDKNEFSGLLQAATNRLVDSQVKSLSFASRFDLVYSAAHGRRYFNITTLTVHPDAFDTVYKD